MATIAALFAIVPACSKKQAEPPSTAAATKPAPAATTQATTAANDDAKPNGTTLVHGIRKLRNLDAPVFVDGKQVSVLRFGELPSSVKPITVPSDSLHEQRWYRLADYLGAIGVDVNRVKRVDVAGVRDKIGGVTGAELRANKDRFVFDFLQTTGGAPKVAWDTTGLENGLRVFDIYALNVFVEKKPWEVDATKHCYVEEGECKPIARFSDDDLIKGTRVYVDGKLVAHVKRRLLADGVTTGTKTGDGEAEFSTDKYLASLGIDTSKAKKIEMLAGDSVVASALGKEWMADRAKLTFALVRHSHGKIQARIPADLQAKTQAGSTDRDVQVTAIEVFNKTEPRQMPLVAIDDVPDLSPLIETAQREQGSAQLADSDHERDQQE